MVAQRRVEIDGELLKVADNLEAALIAQERANSRQVLLLLQHQPLRRIAFERIVQRAHLQEVVEAVQKADSLVLRSRPADGSLREIVVKLRSPSPRCRRTATASTRFRSWDGRFCTKSPTSSPSASMFAEMFSPMPHDPLRHGFGSGDDADNASVNNATSVS